MSEPQRTQPRAGSRLPAEDADRDGRIEQLLLAGLDQYFAGHYEQAIDVWTRVAFLERRNTRARAYIDRARGLLAERQREAEALLHDGVAAYNAGDLPTARALLTRAIERGGQSDTALLFLERLGRIEAVPGLSEPPDRSGPRLRTDTRSGRDRRGWGATLVASVLLAAAILIGARPVASFLAELPIAAPAPARVPPEPLPEALPSQLALDRARAWDKEGRKRDALRALDTIDVASPLRVEADALRARIQRDLLAQAAAVNSSVELPEVRR